MNQIVYSQLFVSIEIIWKYLNLKINISQIFWDAKSFYLFFSPMQFRNSHLFFYNFLYQIQLLNQNEPHLYHSKWKYIWISFYRCQFHYQVLLFLDILSTQMNKIQFSFFFTNFCLVLSRIWSDHINHSFLEMKIVFYSLSMRLSLNKGAIYSQISKYAWLYNVIKC